MTDPIRLLLADDQQMVRAGFRLVLDAQPDICLLYTSPSPRDS